jgi:hypothetical protein
MVTLVNAQPAFKLGLKFLNIKGQPTEIHECDFDVVQKFQEVNKGKELSCTHYKIRNSGEVIQTISSNRKTVVSFSGLSLITDQYTLDGQLEQKIKTQWNRSGYFTSVQSFDGKGFVKGRIEFLYDQGGRNLTEHHYSGSELIWVVNVLFDKQGNRLVEQNVNGNNGNTISKHKFSYDEHGNVLTEENWMHGSYSGKTIYEYDQLGNPIKETNYNEKSLLISEITIKYEYDSQNNWIKRIKYRNSVPYTYSERDIQYGGGMLDWMFDW